MYTYGLQFQPANVMKHLVGVCGVMLVLLAVPSIAIADQALDCHIGGYRLVDGGVVDIAPSDGDTLRWLRFDGKTGVLHRTTGDTWNSTRGWTQQPDGVTVSFPDCKAGEINFNGIHGRRLTFDVENVRFRGHGVTLAGRLVMPPGTVKVPVVIFVHGSEHSSAISSYSTLSYALQRLLPAEGIGMFVYDKRGTGASGGQYTQDFSLLADDVDAAVRETRDLSAPRLRRIGFFGGSEGGWVAPIAANRVHVDFVIVGYGLAVNVTQEDQEEVELQMREKGYSPEVIAKALEVARAAETVMESDLKHGFRKLDAIKSKYGSAPWYKDVYGDYAWIVLQQHSDAQLRAMAPKFDWHTPFHYDPMPTLRADKTSQLWILGGEDYEAPSAETSRRIKSLIRSGLPFTLAYYPHAEHGMMLFETQADGVRVGIRYAPGYFAMIRDFARLGRLPDTYGNAEISRSHVVSIAATVTSFR